MAPSLSLASSILILLIASLCRPSAAGFLPNFCTSSKHCPPTKPVCRPFNRHSKIGRCSPCFKSYECPAEFPVCGKFGKCTPCYLSNKSPCSMSLGRDATEACTDVLSRITAPEKTCSALEFAKELLTAPVEMYDSCSCKCDNVDRFHKPVYVKHLEQCHNRFFVARVRELEVFDDPCPNSFSVPCDHGAMCPDFVFVDGTSFSNKNMWTCPPVPVTNLFEKL